MLLLWTLSAFLAAVQASVWPYHGSLGLVPATGSVINGPTYGYEPSVASSEAHAQSNAHAHAYASSVASGSNTAYPPIYFKGLGSQSAVASATAHSSVGSSSSRGPVYITGPSGELVNIVGPLTYPFSGLGSNSGSAVANSIAQGGGVAGATAVVGPSSVPVSVSGPSSKPVYVTGPSSGPVYITGPSSSPVYVTGPSSGGSASAHAHATSGTAISGASAVPVTVSGPSSRTVYVIGPVAAPAVIRAPVTSPVIVKSVPQQVVWCPPEVPEWRPIPKPFAVLPGRVSPILGSSAGGVVITGPSAPSAIISGPSAPSAIISGPSGTIVTSGGSGWPVTKYW